MQEFQFRFTIHQLEARLKHDQTAAYVLSLLVEFIVLLISRAPQPDGNYLQSIEPGELT